MRQGPRATRLGLEGVIPVSSKAGMIDVATIVICLRLDARLFEPAPPRAPGQKGGPRVLDARDAPRQGGGLVP